MKTTLAILSFVCFVFASQAQPFNFYGSTYYLPNTSTIEPGTILTADGTLADFNYNSASPEHPIFTTGVFYPITDCSFQNIWIQVKHIAADPNGTDVGQNITSSMNSPFLPYGSTDRIGGWNGFYYEFRIYRDTELVGERTNTLAGLFPTGITVASLETLYNDGNTMYEWLAFEILNEETSGWYLNSVNFTGINPYSTPGFASEPYPATTGNSSSAPVGFSTDFPFGSPSIYAVDMNLSSSYHSEFKMSAAGVSIFRYGYEFSSGGYQGMSMEFGVPPVLYADIIPVCGEVPGEITLFATGTQPITFNWGEGNEGPSIDNLSPGSYTVTATDANGCSISQDFTIGEFGSLDVSILNENIESQPYLYSSPVGGIPPFEYEWSTGESTANIMVNESGTYSVIITDANGCEANAEIVFVGMNEELTNNRFKIFPNPASEAVNIHVPIGYDHMMIYSATGTLIDIIRVNNHSLFNISTEQLAKGLYLVQLVSEQLPSISSSFIRD